MIRKLAIIFLLALLVGVNFLIWSFANNPLQLQPWTSKTMGITFDPSRKDDDPKKGISHEEADIDKDLALLEGKFHAVRTYSVLSGLHKIPELAVKHDLNVTVGAWISGDLERNNQEVETLIQIGNQNNPKIVRLMVGNEVLLRTEATREELKESTKKLSLSSLEKYLNIPKEELKRVSEDKNFPIPLSPLAVAWAKKLESPQVVKELLTHYIREVKKRTWRPVSTSETWDRWLANPELAKEVDYIGVHILPFWEGVPIDSAVQHVFDRLHDLQLAFPDKPIVITEVGWPSDGQPVKQAVASIPNQAKFLREFLNRAAKEQLVFNDPATKKSVSYPLAYYIIEAFDQPWKKADEGSAGAYWGIYNADRQLKYPMDGEVIALPAWKNWALGAAIFSLVLMGIFLFSRKSLKLPGILFFGLIANLAASIVFWTVSIGWQQYQTPLTIAFWSLLIAMQVLTLLLMMVESMEIAEILWHPRNPKRAYQPIKQSELPADFVYPKVSVHLPIHNEPPEVVRETLEALAKLDYPDYEVVVIDNNTKNPAVWQPVEADCKRLGEKFRFIHKEGVKGFKAGALNLLCWGEELFNEKTGAVEGKLPPLVNSDPDIIALIDSDYVVNPNWLKSMVPHFYFTRLDDNSSGKLVKRTETGRPVGFVQSPQDYRDRDLNLFKKFCYWEYAGFFYIGMVLRNEYNAIVQHGTMTMVSTEAKLGGRVLEKAVPGQANIFKTIDLETAKSTFTSSIPEDKDDGRWPQYTICEDTALGINLYKNGWDSAYCKESFGKGLMPESLASYMTQRFRWVYGGMQIFKKHAYNLLNSLFNPFTKSIVSKDGWGEPGFTRYQSYHFLAGWLPWFSDALGLLITITSLIISGFLLADPIHSELPIIALLIPTIGVFCFRLLRFLWLYIVCVPCSIWASFGAFFAGMSLTHTVANGVLQGLFVKGKPFIVTPKFKEDSPFLTGLMGIWQELLMLTLLSSAIWAIHNEEQFNNINGTLWQWMLAVQTVPYIAALITLLVSVAPNFRNNKPVN